MDMDRDIGGLIESYRKRRKSPRLSALKDAGGRIHGKPTANDSRGHSGKSASVDTNTRKNYGGR